MYNFLKKIDHDLIEIDESGFDTLIKYEKESLRLVSDTQIQENIKFINLIRNIHN